MVCAYVREDNPRALASGLSPVHTHKHTLTFSMHVYFVHCEIFDVKLWNITQRCITASFFFFFFKMFNVNKSVTYLDKLMAFRYLSSGSVSTLRALGF